MTNTTDDIVKRIEDMQAEMLPGQKSMDKLSLHYLANISVAAELAEAYAALEANLDNIDVLKATGTKLDAIVSPVLIAGRELGDYATGTITFYAPFETAVEIVVPAKTKCYAILGDGSKLYFETTVEGAIDPGELSTTVEAKAVERGLSGNIGAYAIQGMTGAITGITSCENELPFEGGTADETDDALRERYFDAVQAPGKATAMMIQRALNDDTTVSEVKVANYGGGDLGILVDYSGGISETSSDIVDAIEANIAAGTQARGMLCATIDSTTVVVLEDDVYGGLIWVRPKDYISAQEVLTFTYLDMEENEQTAVATIPAGTRRGVMVAAVMASESSRAKLILTAPTSPAGNSYDVLLGMGEAGFLYNLPELTDVSVAATIRLTDTPETGLVDLIEESLTSFLGSYLIGENLEFSDVQKFLQNYFDPTADECIGRPLKGIDEIVSLSVTGGGQTAVKNGDKITVEEDWRLEAGIINITVAT